MTARRMRSISPAWTAVAAALIPILTSVPVATARVPWPTPAMGESRSGDPEVLLTFDDGPEPKRTAKVLDTLRDHHVYAIFFLVGKHLQGKEAESGKAIVDRMLAEGHMVGNHTYSHVHLCHGKVDKAEKEIDDNARIVEEVSGLPPIWFRAPYGDRCKRLIAELEARNLHHVHWDIDPQEWKTHDANGAKNYVIRHLRNLHGRAVLLMHDIQPATSKALPGILDWIQQENERRAKKGERQIRVLDPADVALEQLAPGTMPFLTQLAGDVGGFAPGVVASLAGPMVKAPAAPAPAHAIPSAKPSPVAPPVEDKHPASVLPKPTP